MPKEYELRTIKDIFDKVPADRIEVCMKELSTMIVAAKQLAATLGSVAADLGHDEPALLFNMSDGSIVWRDDGKGELRANFPGLLMTLEMGQEDAPPPDTE